MIAESARLSLLSVALMSDAGLIAMFGGIPGSIAAIATLIIAVRGSKKADKMASVGEKTHTLVNSNFSAQLEISSLALRRVADITKHPDDVRAAETAERLLSEQRVRQSAVDEKEAQESLSQ